MCVSALNVIGPAVVRASVCEIAALSLPGLAPESEAVDRVALTVRFLTSGLAGWERDTEAGGDGAAPLAPFTLVLTDLALAMLDAPTSVEM